MKRDRAVSFGRELAPGKVADKNFVWLSERQLDNINNNYLMPIHLETYRHLKNHIAKALVPLLQIWLFAERHLDAAKSTTTRLASTLRRVMQLASSSRGDGSRRSKTSSQPTRRELRVGCGSLPSPIHF
jgi:hypothetical protein